MLDAPTSRACPANHCFAAIPFTKTREKYLADLNVWAAQPCSRAQSKQFVEKQQALEAEPTESRQNLAFGLASCRDVDEIISVVENESQLGAGPSSQIAGLFQARND